jgi:hypothetical protein
MTLGKRRGQYLQIQAVEADIDSLDFLSHQNHFLPVRQSAGVALALEQLKEARFDLRLLDYIVDDPNPQPCRRCYLLAHADVGTTNHRTTTNHTGVGTQSVSVPCKPALIVLTPSKNTLHCADLMV